jgi:AcrR family transcriptional regulator
LGKPVARKKESRKVPAPRWRRRAEARPAEILEAALTVFSARGFAAAKLDDVAKEAGVSKGTL